MSEAWLLSMVFRYPRPKALARKAQNGAVIAGMRSLVRRGFVTRSRDNYRLTRRGRDELAMACAIARLAWRADPAAR
jgi:predicted transcriptional regulator